MDEVGNACAFPTSFHFMTSSIWKTKLPMLAATDIRYVDVPIGSFLILLDGERTWLLTDGLIVTFGRREGVVSLAALEHYVESFE